MSAEVSVEELQILTRMHSEGLKIVRDFNYLARKKCFLQKKGPDAIEIKNKVFANLQHAQMVEQYAKYGNVVWFSISPKGINLVREGALQ